MLKPQGTVPFRCSRLITVQDNTMLKPCNERGRWLRCLITVQDNTMLKHKCNKLESKIGLITVQDNTMLKPP